jgi:hypothetical protein
MVPPIGPRVNPSGRGSAPFGDYRLVVTFVGLGSPMNVAL